MARDRGRRIEGSLLVFVLLFILAPGFVLVFLAKTREGVPTDAININAASADELAVNFEIVAHSWVSVMVTVGFELTTRLADDESVPQSPVTTT